MKHVIAVDLDHTLVIGDKPIDGARDAMSLLHEKGYFLMIHTCNGKQWAEKVLRDNDIWFDYIWQGEKPVADCYIDDRAVGFRGDWTKTVEEVLEHVESKNKGRG